MCRIVFAVATPDMVACFFFAVLLVKFAPWSPFPVPGDAGIVFMFSHVWQFGPIVADVISYT